MAALHLALQDNHTDPAMCPAAWLTRGRTWYSKVFRCWLNLAAHRGATAFLRLPSVHRAGPEGQQRVEAVNRRTNRIASGLRRVPIAGRGGLTFIARDPDGNLILFTGRGD
jgi:hypothetical protein